MRTIGWLAAVAAVVLAACGGKVVIDTGGAGAAGQGGAGQGGAGQGGASHPSGTGGASCNNPPDPSLLTFCSGGVTSGGADVQCENDFCDAHGNTWAALCTPSTCQCKYNGVELCMCSLNGPGSFCSTVPTCCPVPMAGN